MPISSIWYTIHYVMHFADSSCSLISIHFLTCDFPFLQVFFFLIYLFTDCHKYLSMTERTCHSIIEPIGKSAISSTTLLPSIQQRRSKSQNEHLIFKNQKTRNFIPSSLIISQATLIKYLVFLNLFTHVQTSLLSPMSTPQGCQHRF